MMFVEKPYRGGTVVNGRYTIQALLGEGSYGMAYVARHVLRRMLQLDRPYASVEQLMRDVVMIQ